VLSSGEPGLDTTTRQLKIGNGATAWATLPAVASGVPIFTTTQRDALTGGNLYRGLTIFNSDTGAVEVYYGATTLWKPPWNVAWGEVAKTVSTANTALGAGAATVDVFTVAFTAVANRRYKLSAYVTAVVGGTTLNAGFAITDNTPTTLNQEGGSFMVSGTILTSAPWAEVNPAAGSVTYRVRASIGAGGGTLSLLGAGNGNTHYLLVEDMGANGNAPAV
jgi:hypothetical protein